MKRLIVLTICFMFVGVIAFAEPAHEWKVGTEISNRKYEEPGVMEQEGIMYGLLGSYTYRNGVMLRAEGLYSFGQVDYKNSGTMDDIDDYVLEFRGLAGYDHPLSETSTLTPYIGIGYRYLFDEFGNRLTSTNAVGYDRESQYIYSPIGVEITAPLKNSWSVRTILEYDIFWWGQQKSYMSQARVWSAVPGWYTHNDVENDQDGGYGIRGSIEFQKKGEKLDFAIEPFIRYWNIKDSETVTDTVLSENGLWLVTTPFTEPKNETTEIGIKFAVKF
ncbi:MAG: autotransporter outer membrane beta-barrel domain-containing protein [Nitrospirota bacterium]